MRGLNLVRAAILLIALLWVSPAVALDPVPGCPEGYTCLLNETFEKVKLALTKLKKIEESQPTFKTDPIYIVTDRQDRIYSSGGDPEPAKGEMTWGDFVVHFKWSPKLTVSQVVEDDWGFRPRFKAMLWVNVFDFNSDEPEKFIDVGVAFEFLYVQLANLQLYVGTKSFGAAIGFDFTKNFGLVAGLSFLYRNITSPTPMAGLFFSFN